MQAKRPAAAPRKLTSGAVGWKTSPAIRLLLFLIIAIFTYASMADKVIPKLYQLEVGSIVEKPITAPRPIENVIATRKAQKEAAEQIAPVFSVISQRNEVLVEQIFDALEQINADEALTATDKANVFQMELPKLYNDFTERSASTAASSYGAPVIEEMKKQLQEKKYKMPVQMYFKMPRFLKEELQEMRPIAAELVKRAVNEQLTDVDSARTRVAELVNQSQLTKSTQRELVQEIVRFSVTPSRFFDQSRTDDAKEAARNAVKPVMVQRGETLLDRGQIVTQDIFDWLKDERVLSERRDYRPWIGLVIWAGLTALVLWTAVRRSQSPIRMNNPQLLMLTLIFAINLLLIRITEMAQTDHYPQIGYLVPVGVGVMLIAILLEAQLAFVSAILFGLISGVVFNLNGDSLFDMSYAFVAITAGLTACYAVQRTGQRSLLLRAGILVSLASLAAVGSLILLARGEAFGGAAFSAFRDVALPLLFAFAGGLVTAVLVIGLLPFFESMFGILSPLKLVELSNPNHPLLRKVLTETPGTYHHSIMVANLSESAAEAIGANGLLCRVGSFYHDVGKTKRPSYFIENQTNIENPHDRIEPSLSKSIIIAHARDGADMLKEYNIPKPIRDIAEQHHGTTLLKYFYHKAVKQAGENPEHPITEEEYRYPGPKAQSKEAAIVGIADCIEAAVRSLRNPTVEHIDGMVRKIIKDRLDDGQFNECDLTLKELDVIAKTINETLLGMFHSRIEYPADEPQSKGDKKLS